MAMGPSGARYHEWPCRLIVGSKLLLLRFLLHQEEWISVVWSEVESVQSMTASYL
jgi:hypothetical protein